MLNSQNKVILASGLMVVSGAIAIFLAGNSLNTTLDNRSSAAGRRTVALKLERDNQGGDYCYKPQFNQSTMYGEGKIIMIGSTPCVGGKAGNQKYICKSNQILANRSDSVSFSWIDVKQCVDVPSGTPDCAESVIDSSSCQDYVAEPKYGDVGSYGEGRLPRCSSFMFNADTVTTTDSERPDAINKARPIGSYDCAGGNMTAKQKVIKSACLAHQISLVNRDGKVECRNANGDPRKTPYAAPVGTTLCKVGTEALKWCCPTGKSIVNGKCK